jgi:curved DNA-binding protein CbpA
VAPQLSREEALRLLGLPPSAEQPAVKRAYRRLARRHHPDVGGDPATFHRLRLAVECLLETTADAPAPERVARGRPSRPGASWRADQTVDTSPVDLSVVDWGRPLTGPDTSLSRDLAACHLAAEQGPLVHRLHATSRAPGSRLNRLASKLSPDLTAYLEVRPALDDRRRPVVLIEVVGANRRARRALDRIPLQGDWMRLRGSSTTMLRASLVPSADRRATALRTVRHLERLLERLEWPLHAWIRTP